ncbi:fungal trichothecene efflux pump [Coniochaeta sp. 2T2.1]|nr:fungal trichothecene efflux pump [Coniochaeta sp. 2T2.1]
METHKSEITAAHASAEDVHAPEATSHGLEKKHESDVIGGFEADIDTLPPGYFKSRFFIGTFFAIGFSLIAGVGAFGYAAPILGIINADIGPDPRYTWISLVYNAALAVCIAPLGRITDIFGRRWWFIGSGVVSVIGSIVCATANDIPTLIGGNVLLGVGTAAQLSFHYVLGEIVPMKYRYYAGAAIYVFSIAGSGIGPLIPYSFIQYHPQVGWRGVYWVLLGLNVLALVCWALFYFPPSFDKLHRADVHNSKSYWIKNFDYVGTFLFAAGFVLFLMGLSWGGVVYPWNHPAPICGIVIGFAVMVLFVLWEIYAPIKEPLVPMHLFKNIEWTVSVILLSMGASVYYGFAIVWPAQCATLWNTGGLIYLGLISSIIGLAIIAGQIVGGIACKRIGHTRIQVMVVFTLGAIFLGATAAAQPDTFKMAVALVVIGLFFTGWNESVCLANTTICVTDQQLIGTAGGLAGSMRSGICAIIVAIYTTVLTNRMGQTIPAQVPPALVDAGLPASSVADFIGAIGGGGALDAIPGITDKIIEIGTAAYKQASADAYRTVYLSTLAFSGIAIILTYWAPNTNKYMTDNIAATLHREDVSDNEKVVSDN